MIFIFKLEIENSEIIYDLPRQNGNPRNSEGDFAVLNDGRILFAYSHYIGESEEDDAPCNIGALISSDGGRSFAKLPFFLVKASDHNTSNIMSVSFCRLDNGILCLFYLCKYGAQSEYVLRRCTDEQNLIFDKPETVIPKTDGIYFVVNNCRVLKLADGCVLVPAARHKIIKGLQNEDECEYFAESCIYKGDSNAENWSQFSPDLQMPFPGYSETGLQEPGVSELKDGRIYAYFRTDRAFQYESFYTAENGWSVPAASGFTSPESPMLIKMNPYSCIYYAFWNPVPNYNGRLYNEKRWIHSGRNPFVAAVSENGTDFSRYAVIESDPFHGYCYPSVLFLNEKEFLLSYCCGGEEDYNCLTHSVIRRITLK